MKFILPSTAFEPSCSQDVTSPHATDVATALDGLSHILTPDLGRDLSLDLLALLNHSRPRIRKRAVLIMYRLLVKYPEVTSKAFPRIREKLEDEDPSEYETLTAGGYLLFFRR